MGSQERGPLHLASFADYDALKVQGQSARGPRCFFLLPTTIPLYANAPLCLSAHQVADHLTLYQLPGAPFTGVRLVTLFHTRRYESRY